MKKMRKFIAALLVMSFVLALATTAFAYVDKEANKWVIFKGSAYGYKKIYNNIGHKKDLSDVVLRKGSIAQVKYVKGDWYKIAIPKKSGVGDELIYFNKKFTMKAPIKETLLIYSTAGKRGGRGSQKDVYDVSAIKGIKIKTSGSTKLYKEGSLSSKVIKSLKRGKTVKLLGTVAIDKRKNTYFKVSYGSKKGFVPASRLDRTDTYWIMKKIKALVGE